MKPRWDGKTLTVGELVVKRSGKPFKSAQKVNTIASVITNPNTGKPAYTFVEDDSVVDVIMCMSKPNMFAAS